MPTSNPHFSFKKPNFKSESLVIKNYFTNQFVGICSVPKGFEKLKIFFKRKIFY